MEDKLRIVEQLDRLGIAYIEGGPARRQPEGHRVLPPGRTGAEPGHLDLLVAFGSTRRPKGKVDDDATLRNLIEAGTEAVRIVAKSWDYHVLNALNTSPTRGRHIADFLVEFLRSSGRRVMVDAGALLRRVQAQPRVRHACARSCCGQGRQPPRALVTPTAARCRTRSSTSSAVKAHSS
ncbi:MAG: hypothetical protein R2705_19065 [Ilumatobacteraceae bacterium]